MTLMVSTTIYGVTMWCRGVANNYTCYRQLYRFVPVLFTPVQLSTLYFFCCASFLFIVPYWVLQLTVDTQCYLSVGIIYSH